MTDGTIINNKNETFQISMKKSFIQFHLFKSFMIDRPLGFKII